MAFRLLTTAALLAAAADAGSLLKQAGRCTNTTIKQIGTLPYGVAGNGDAVDYTNGGYRVEYTTMKGRTDDPIQLCLTSLPESCPPGDDCDRACHAIDLRTRQSRTAFDSGLMCGDA